MISCTEFIPAYSEFFKFLHQKAGRKEVDRFWNYLSDTYLKDTLKRLIKQHGLRGCWLYWTQTLNEEAAEFVLVLDEDNNYFGWDMRKCPSKGRLLKYRHCTPYPDYCRHCDALYNRVLKPLGYEYKIDFSRCDRAQCKGSIRKRV